jgi:Spy/CpxP family protein refolding chaperone
MDWLFQNKIRDWLIAILLVINILTVSILWMQTARTNEPQPQQTGARGSESVTLLQKALDLNEGQVKQLDTKRTGHLELTKSYNDRLSALKRQLSEELFKEHPDTTLAHSLTAQIGELQSKVELIRFEYFKELLALCTPEQKAKLRPIVTELFGRKPPKEATQVKAPRPESKEEQPSRDVSRDDKKVNPPPNREDRPGPPSVDERMAKMGEKLNLTPDQAQKIRAILSITMKEDKALKDQVNPDRNKIQAEKDRLRQKEDESIMKLLDESQKKEFLRMIQNRRR